MLVVSIEVAAMLTWTGEEDELLRELVSKHGTKNWVLVASKIGSKSSKQCSRRWKNFINMKTKTTLWTESEDEKLIAFHRELGNRWTEISRRFGDRTDNAVKNRWHSLCRKNPGLLEEDTPVTIVGVKRGSKARLYKEDAYSDVSAVKKPLATKAGNNSTKSKEESLEPPKKRAHNDNVTGGDNIGMLRPEDLIMGLQRYWAGEEACNSDRTSNGDFLLPSSRFISEGNSMLPQSLKQPNGLFTGSVNMPSPFEAQKAHEIPWMAPPPAITLSTKKGALSERDLELIEQLNQLNLPIQIQMGDSIAHTSQFPQGSSLAISTDIPANSLSPSLGVFDPGTNYNSRNTSDMTRPLLKAGLNHSNMVVGNNIKQGAALQSDKFSGNPQFDLGSSLQLFGALSSLYNKTGCSEEADGSFVGEMLNLLQSSRSMSGTNVHLDEGDGDQKDVKKESSDAICMAANPQGIKATGGFDPGQRESGSMRQRVEGKILEESSDAMERIQQHLLNAGSLRNTSSSSSSIGNLTEEQLDLLNRLMSTNRDTGLDNEKLRLGFHSADIPNRWMKDGTSFRQLDPPHDGANLNKDNSMTLADLLNFHLKSNSREKVYVNSKMDVNPAVDASARKAGNIEDMHNNPDKYQMSARKKETEPVIEESKLQTGARKQRRRKVIQASRHLS